MSFSDMQIELSVVQEMFPCLSERDIRSIKDAHPHVDIQELMDILLKENTKKTEPAGVIQTRGGDTSPEPDRERYKLDPCPDYDCSKRGCQFYHDLTDKRRDPSKFEYQPKPCFNVNYNGAWGDPNQCSHKNSCVYCHTENELQYHPKQIPTNHSEATAPAESDDRGLRRKSEDLDREIQRLKEEENGLSREIDELKKANLCAMCMTNPLVVVYEPCYHPMCFVCNYKTNEVCLKCGDSINERHIRPSN